MIEELGSPIGAGRVAEIYAHGDDVLKLYRSPLAKADAFLEAAALAAVASHGLPVPQVLEAGRYAGRWGLRMTRAPGETLAATALREPARIPEMLDAMVRVQLSIHACRETRLRRLTGRLAARLDGAAGLAPELRGRLRARLTGLQDGDRLCHGDFHPLNLVGPLAAPVVIDWLDATSGPPAADACRSYLLLSLVRPDLAEGYLERYSLGAGLPRGDILAWLPVLAAARLAEDPSEDERARLLAFAAGA
jgi:aminoglycoside phosphotransferase (APT) family kinase protein